MDDIHSYEFLFCSSCGIKYGVPKHFIEARWENREAAGRSRSWYCPNGHSQIFKETEFDVLRRERDRLRQEMARIEEERDAARRAADEANKNRRVVEAKLTRTMDRAGAGVCPCCNRTFQALARHMKSRHPDVVPIARKAARNA